jgi:dephospho-CoA kinase
MKLPEIVGISGTNGAGKDVLGLLLAKRCGYHFHSVSDLLREELTRTGKEITRENLRTLSRQWRQESGDDAIMFTKAIEKYLAEKDEKGYKGLALVNARHPGEAKHVQEHGGVVVWVDGDQRLRYDRLQASNRGRAEDQKTFEEFKSEEEQEMYPPANAPAGTLHMAAVKEIADIIIMNNYATVDEYRNYLIKEFDL